MYLSQKVNFFQLLNRMSINFLIIESRLPILFYPKTKAYLCYIFSYITHREILLTQLPIKYIL